jgi:hypothetical protein
LKLSFSVFWNVVQAFGLVALAGGEAFCEAFGEKRFWFVNEFSSFFDERNS